MTAQNNDIIIKKVSIEPSGIWRLCSLLDTIIFMNDATQQFIFAGENAGILRVQDFDSNFYGSYCFRTGDGDEYYAIKSARDPRQYWSVWGLLGEMGEVHTLGWFGKDIQRWKIMPVK